MDRQFHISLNNIYYQGAQNKHKNPWNENKLVLNPIWLVRFQIKYSGDTEETFCIILYTSFFTLKTNLYYSAIKRNKIELFVVRWMDLEYIIQSEVSQKNKYHMLTHIYGI